MCTVAPLPYLRSDLPPPSQTKMYSTYTDSLCVGGGGGFWPDSEPTTLLHHPKQMTRKADIKGLVSLFFHAPHLPRHFCDEGKSCLCGLKQKLDSSSGDSLDNGTGSYSCPHQCRTQAYSTSEGREGTSPRRVKMRLSCSKEAVDWAKKIKMNRIKFRSLRCSPLSTLLVT
jgi:hypothetical protein